MLFVVVNGYVGVLQLGSFSKNITVPNDHMDFTKTSLLGAYYAPLSRDCALPLKALLTFSEGCIFV